MWGEDHGGSRWLPDREGTGWALDPAGEGEMGKTIPSRVCGSVTEVRAGAKAAGNGRWHWGWGLWSLGLQGRGVREAMGAFGLKEFSV